MDNPDQPDDRRIADQARHHRRRQRLDDSIGGKRRTVHVVDLKHGRAEDRRDRKHEAELDGPGPAKPKGQGRSDRETGSADPGQRGHRLRQADQEGVEDRGLARPLVAARKP